MEVIKNLDQLLKNELGATKEIKQTKISVLTQPGDNFGSLMLKLDVVLKNKNNNKEEDLALVAKKIPVSIFFQKVFNIQVTFKKEVAFYNQIIPTLEKFTEEYVQGNLKFFPKCYAHRFNLNDVNDDIDEDGVLILENLKTKGYTNVDRQEGFDLETSKLILQNLAQLHATALALRLKQPNIFNEKVKTFCHDESFASDRYVTFNQYSKDILLEHNECAPLANKVIFLNAANKQPVNDIYGTVIHFDMWVNNIMLKFVDGKAIATKLVDFQVYNYGSPGSDLMFFLGTSIQDKVLTENVDELIEFYHQCFLNILKGFNCDVTNYTIESLLDEIRTHSKFEFGHVFFFNSFVINSKQKEENGNEHGKPQDALKSLTQRSKEKAWLITLEFEKRGWLPKLN